MRGVALASIVVAFLATSVRYNSWVAGGSDSYCYVHQAERWAQAVRQLVTRGTWELQEPEPLALAAPWPDAARAFAPAGHLPSTTIDGAAVPVCPAGLSIIMAPLVMAAGPRAAFGVLPFFGALLVLATHAVGARFGARIGLASALLVATNPIVLYQVMQPMSDIPAAALWTIAVACATGSKPRLAMRAGLATSAAIMMRPNLLPLGVVIGVFLLLRPERVWRDRLRTALRYAAWCVPGCLAVALTQQAFYGSPFASGYGSMTLLFRTEHVRPNVQRYVTWLRQTQTPAVVLALLAPWLLPGGLVALFVAMIAVNLVLYLPYVVFDDWSFVRFLLPTLPLLIVLVVAVVDAIWRRARLPRPAIALAVVVAILAVVSVRIARERNAFRLQRLEARFARTGEYAARRLPENALVITSRHSGSIRFYAGRKTLVWDGLPPDSLDTALQYVRGRGFEPYLLFEASEEPIFRQRFANTVYGALDWPPIAQVGAQVRIYRPEDRERYLQGISPPTEYAR